MMASMICAPTVCTGLNAAIGSCGISAISAPRRARIWRPRGGRRTRSICSVPWRYRISPLVMRPGGSISCRIARIVTLFPQPLSPTIPTTWPGNTSKLTPSTARTMPSSSGNDTRRLRTRNSGSVAVGIGCIAQAIAHQVERQHCDDDDDARDQQPRCQSKRLNILCLLQQHAPTDRRRANAKTKERQRSLVDDHHRNGERAGSNDVAHEGRHHVTQDDAHSAASGQPCSQHEVFLAQCEEAAAYLSCERGPADQRQDHGDCEEHLERRPVARQGGRQCEPY